MNKLQQFREQLNTILDGNDNLTKVLGAFDEAYNDNEGIKQDLITQRNDLKTTNKEVTALVEVAKSTLGLEEITAEAIGTVLNEKQGDATAIRAELTTKYDEKYSNDFNTLKTQMSELEAQKNDITGKYNDNLFNSGVKNTDAFKSTFVEDTDAQNSIILPKLKEKLIYENGQVFRKDDTTGGIAYELGTNKPLDPAGVIKEVADSISPIYLQKQSVSNGMGTTNTPQNNSQKLTLTEIHAMSDAKAGIN